MFVGFLLALAAINFISAKLDELPISPDARFIASAVYFAAACILLVRKAEKQP
jgi:hypothetical protein